MFSTIEKALKDVKNGKFILVVDDDDRENEGDLAIAADFVTPEAVNFFAREGRGLICCSMAPALVDLGVDLLAAHLFVFYFGILADDTPPVGLAASQMTVAQREGLAAFERTQSCAHFAWIAAEDGSRPVDGHPSLDDLAAEVEEPALELNEESGEARAVIVGVGNCASSLIQGVSYCRAFGEQAVGVSFPELGGYTPADIEIVAGFDVDARKVGRTLGEAAFALPNCTERFHTDLSEQTGLVHRGPDLDGVASHMLSKPEDRSFRLSGAPALSHDEIVQVLRDCEADVMIIFLPVGSQKAVEFYAQCALDAGVALVNGIPVFIASNPVWAAKFVAAGLPCIGDDFKAQFGATIVHRTLANLADMRGVEIDRTYQLNTGGNTDFLNMLNRSRLESK